MRVDNLGSSYMYNRIDSPSEVVKEGEVIKATIIDKRDNYITILLSNGKTMDAKIDMPLNNTDIHINIMVNKIVDDTIIGTLVKESQDKSLVSIDDKINNLLLSLKLAFTKENIIAAKALMSAHLPVNEDNIKEMVANARILQAFTSTELSNLSNLIPKDERVLYWDIKNIVKLIDNTKVSSNSDVIEQGLISDNKTEVGRAILPHEFKENSIISEAGQSYIEESSISNGDARLLGWECTGNNLVRDGNKTSNLAAQDSLNPIDMPTDEAVEEKKSEEFQLSNNKPNSTEQINKENLNFSEAVNRMIFLKKNQIPLNLKNILAQKDLFNERTMEQLIKDVTNGKLQDDQIDLNSPTVKQVGQESKMLLQDLKEGSQLQQITTKIIKELITLSKTVKEDKHNSIMETEKTLSGIRLENALTLPKQIEQNYSHFFIPYSANERLRSAHLIIKKNAKGKSVDKNNASILLSLSTSNIGVVDCHIRVHNKNISLKFFVDDEIIKKKLVNQDNQLNQYLSLACYKLTSIEIDVKSNKDIFERISMLDSISEKSIDIRV